MKTLGAGCATSLLLAGLLTAACGAGAMEADSPLFESDGVCAARLEELDSGLMVDQSCNCTCRMHMVDNFNGIDTILQVEMQDKYSYLVTQDYGADNAWSLPVSISGNGLVVTMKGIPEITMEALLADYEYKSGTQVEFNQVEGCPCTDFETSLLYFLVMEWFYYG